MAYSAKQRIQKFAPPVVFIRGDCNGDGKLTDPIADALTLLGWFFLGNPEPPCLAACDASGNGEVASNPIAETIYVLHFWYLSTDPPPAPYPDCGAGTLPTDVRLGCASPPMVCQ